MFNVRLICADDAAALVSLRREALETDPLSFVASLEDERDFSLEFVRHILAHPQEQAVFGAFDGERLIGMVGLYRETKLKRCHLGSIWGMYVTPEARGKGAGHALLDMAIRCAHEWGLDQLQLGVTDIALAARHLYEAAGFRSWGCEPRALRWEGLFVDEHHFSLDLHRSE
ncbi:MAG: GNAT family N-acetyltransferase [Anaerolineae bacterium]|nr:GNAT family N-acetyltransferase [Anaerolineae bacterium]